MRRYCLSFLLLLSGLLCYSQSLIPKPTELKLLDGKYTLDKTISVSSPSSLFSSYTILKDYVENTLGCSMVDKKGRASITLKENDSFKEEQYRLFIDKNGITAEGRKSGVFYAIRTLEQLMDQYGLELPCMTINDSPRFSWRGLMLDCGRYFYPVEFIKAYIDRMSCYKLNVLHWHLSEDGGWRIEIKSHPELTATSAWRRSTQKTHNWNNQDNIPHGGYYTQKQVREIIEYASARNVTIVPEIDLPGHTKCILAAHPELGCTGEKVYPEIRWQIWEDVLCIGNEGTLAIIKDILSEIIDLFPSEYINIGGDEAPQAHWEKCPKCQALMKSEGITSPRGLQSWLTARMDEFVRSKGRKILGWDEILEGGKLGKDVAVMNYQNSEKALDAVKNGNKVIMTPAQYLYIDYYQSDDTANEPYAIGGYLPLEKVYSFQPITESYNKEQENLVLGLQANLWCEYVHNCDHAWYMTFPRALASAEIGWSHDRTKDYEGFRERLSDILYAMDRDQIPFRIPEPVGLFNPKIENGKAVIDLKVPVNGSEIYYTTDGKDPQYYGKLYSSPVSVPLSVNGVNFTCTVKLPSGRFSAPYKCRNR